MLNNLEKFRYPSETYETVKSELRNEKKVTHWMWYVFPQLYGLGYSSVSQYYGIINIDEAKMYYADDMLRKRLEVLINILLNYDKKVKIQSVFGDIDTKKLQSCMTLFYLASKDTMFKRVLDKFYNGELDQRTLSLLKR